MNNRTGAAGAFFRAAGFLRKACSKAPDIIRLRERIRRSGLQGPMKRKLRRLAWRGKTYQVDDYAALVHTRWIRVRAQPNSTMLIVR